MATIRWRGNASEVAQVTTVTPANVEVGDVFSLTMNGRMVSYTAVAPTVADVTAGLAAAWTASSLPEFLEATASDSGSEVVLTAATAGIPFEVSTSTVNGGGTNTQTLTAVTTTPSSGRHHWDTAANWSTGALPVVGDDVFIEDSETSILYGLDQSAVTLTSLHITASYTGEIGLATTNETGPSNYPEYRLQELQVGATTVGIGSGNGIGSGRIRLDTGSNAAAITVHTTGIASDNDQYAFQWKGANAGNTLAIYAGSVGVATGGGESATVATLRMSGGDVRCASGVNLTTLERSGGGHMVIESSATTLNQSSGETLVLGTGTLSTINIDGGRIDYRSSGTIVDVTLDGPDAILDFSVDLRPRTVTDLTLLRGALLDPHQTVAWTNGVQAATGLRAP